MSLYEYSYVDYIVSYVHIEKDEKVWKKNCDSPFFVDLKTCLCTLSCTSVFCAPWNVV